VMLRVFSFFETFLNLNISNSFQNFLKVFKTFKTSNQHTNTMQSKYDAQALVISKLMKLN
jgi:hypothetical protein